jgi:hypothetical protein
MPKEFPLFGTWSFKYSGGPGSVSFKQTILFCTVCLAALGGAFLLPGCTSDLPSEVGTGLVDSQIDMVLEPLILEDIEIYKDKNIGDADLPVASQEVLYLGSQQGNSSSILLNYDFGNIFTLGFPESTWTAENITSIKLRFLMLEYYGHLRDGEGDTKSDKVLAKFYDVFELDYEFDPGAYPGPVPAHGLVNMNIDYQLDDSEYLEIPISEPFFLSWVEAGITQGLIVSEGPGSVQGLSGFSSREMLHPASSLIDYDVGTIVAPVLAVKFAHNDSTYFIQPWADTSTFHEISVAPTDPADGMMMRTCLRTYPMLRFDFSSLPNNAFINRAVLSVSNDTTRSFGNLQSMVISEIDTDNIGTPGDTMPLLDLETAVYQISGMVNLDPILNQYLEFNVTTAVQRIVNGVYEGERAFIMTAGEDFFPSYDIDSIDPDFYFTQFSFFGTSDAVPDSLRPKLKISYTQMDVIEGGDE